HDCTANTVSRMLAEGSTLSPAIDPSESRAARSAARPLIGAKDADSGHELSRTFKTIDHVEDGVAGFVTITGGKATTLRGMAELCGDVICRKLGIDRPCSTRSVTTLPHTAFYAETERRLA